jgi:hypothetical protein
MKQRQNDYKSRQKALHFAVVLRAVKSDSVTGFYIHLSKTGCRSVSIFSAELDVQDVQRNI